MRRGRDGAEERFSSTRVAFLGYDIYQRLRVVFSSVFFSYNERCSSFSFIIIPRTEDDPCKELMTREATRRVSYR